jgi:hypothetical protein
VAWRWLVAQRPDSSDSGVLEGAAVDTDPLGGPDQSPPIVPDSDLPTPSDNEFDTLVEEIQRRRFWDSATLPYLEDRIRRRLGLAPSSAAAVVLAVLVGLGTRLVVVLLATAVVGEWAGLPWGRWAVILAATVVYDALRPFAGPPVDVAAPTVFGPVEDWTPLLPTIVQESDLRDLAGFLRRLNRPRVSALAGVATATFMLTLGWLLAPDALAALPAGSIVLLALLMIDFGSTVIYWSILVGAAFIARVVRYDHRLFWPSPADSPAIHKAMRKVTGEAFATGIWITIYLLLTVVVVTWDSPLVVPLGGGFILLGYLATLGAALSGRAGIQKIVQRAREQRLRGLQERIDDFGPTYADLSPEESQQLRDLLFLHDKIRDAPATPTTARTVMHTAVTLIIPTILFLATVFGEVYAERFLDAILP